MGSRGVERARSCGALLGIAMAVTASGWLSFADCRAQTVTPEYRADIMKLVHITGTDSMAVTMVTYMAGTVMEALKTEHPEGADSVMGIIKDEVARVMRENLGTVLDRMVPAYANHYTHEDVRAMIGFYQTPLAAKILRETPLLMQETMAIGQAWAQEIVPPLMKRLDARLGIPPEGAH